MQNTMEQARSRRQPQTVGQVVLTFMDNDTCNIAVNGKLALDKAKAKDTIVKGMAAAILQLVTQLQAVENAGVQEASAEVLDALPKSPILMP